MINMAQLSFRIDEGLLLIGEMEFRSQLQFAGLSVRGSSVVQVLQIHGRPTQEVLIPA